MAILLKYNFATCAPISSLDDAIFRYSPKFLQGKVLKHSEALSSQNKSVYTSKVNWGDIRPGIYPYSGPHYVFQLGPANGQRGRIISAQINGARNLILYNGCGTLCSEKFHISSMLSTD